MQVRKYLLLICFMLATASGLWAQTMTTAQYIAAFKSTAMVEMQRSGVPAAIKLAQGILETQSGNGWLVLNSNNHFGIKCKNNWKGKTVSYDDDARGECFRVYETAGESYKDHSDFLRQNPRYSFLFQFDPEDYKSWAYGLKQAGYATNPRYPQQLIKIIEDNNLQSYTLLALRKISVDPQQGDAEPPVYAGNTPKRETPVYVPRTSKPAMVGRQYPKGIFEINGRRVIVAKAGTSLIQLADQQGMRLSRLLRFNDLPDDRPLKKDMLLFLQKKNKRGNTDVHTVASGESMHDIAQAEGIQLRWLRRRNKMREGEEPAPGQRVSLNGYADRSPRLIANATLKPEDQEPEDFSPREVIEDVKEEVAKARQPQPAAQQPQTAPQGGVPVAMMDDLKKMGDVRTSGPAAPVPATTPATQPVRPAVPQQQPQRSVLQYHDVQPKETLFGIAKMYSVSITQLQEWNNLQGNDIKIGQRLLVGK